MNEVIKELNHFLEGNYMAIHAYDQYIYRIKDQKIKEVFQQIQQEHKKHAQIVAERIQNVGGKPVDDVGMKGKMVEMLEKMKGTDGISAILKDAIAGENRGIKVSKDLVRGDLDEESLALVKDILNADEGHVQQLQDLLK
ncbi:ferritin-like domain-containing protein [Salirhabdus sp. Marseille-P4669]|uniref:ferritin-like domain-containing protein n=1 Tax=Salirhabdus sp. Marseille-P4669 TaxID=2042310 RepID=UPI000C7A0B67|nr:ferritin-like domain-containing protein [Salirhabdus sp. Marseille-P4669]